MRNLFICLTLAALVGCASGPKPKPEVCQQIPEGYLQECTLPSLFVATGELSEALVQAWLCGAQGNKDKKSIRALQKSED